MTDNQIMTQRVVDEAFRQLRETLESKLPEGGSRSRALDHTSTAQWWAEEAVKES